MPISAPVATPACASARWIMITSGSSGLFPKDYPIGTIQNIGFDSNGLSVCADIQPCVDPSRLTSVIVIIDFSGKKEDSDEDQDHP